MRFSQILPRRQRERVATRVTNSSEFGDKLKTALIAYFKRPGAINRHGGRPFRTRTLFFRLFTFSFMTIKSKRRKNKIKNRSTWVRPWLAKRKEQGFYHQLLTEISVANILAFPELLRMTRLSCRVDYTGAIYGGPGVSNANKKENANKKKENANKKKRKRK